MTSSTRKKARRSAYARAPVFVVARSSQDDAGATSAAREKLKIGAARRSLANGVTPRASSTSSP
jgi:hypothetical protein